MKRRLGSGQLVPHGPYELPELPPETGIDPVSASAPYEASPCPTCPKNALAIPNARNLPIPHKTVLTGLRRLEPLVESALAI